MTAERRTAIIIGAGLSGMTAAYRLQQAGVDVSVLECGPRLGGRAVSLRRDGFIFDRGADAILGCYAHYFQLVKDLGLESSLVPVTAPAATIRNGTIISYSGSAMSIATSKLLSWRAKANVAIGMTRLSSALKAAETTALYRLADLDDPASSSRAFSERYFGREATDYLIEPMVRLFNGTTAAGASAADVLGGLILTMTGNFTMRGGVGVVPEALAARLPIRYDAEARAVNEVSGGVEVQIRTAGGAEETLRADGCVLAIMLEDAAALHEPTAAATAELRASLAPPASQPYMHLIKIQLAYSTRARSDAFVIQSPVPEDGELMGIFLDHHKCPDRAPAGHSMVSVYMDGHVSARFDACSDDDRTAWARGKAEALMPELRGHFMFSEVSNWPRVGICNHPGYYRLSASALAKVTDDSAVQGASDWFTKTSQETAVARGESAAAALLARWTAPGSQTGSREQTEPSLAPGVGRR